MTLSDDVHRLAERLAVEGGSPGDGSPSTVELVDEDDPDGMVVFRNADGSPFMWMPAQDYFKLRDRLERRSPCAPP